MNRISIKVTDWLITKEIIDSKKRGIYEYGIRQLCSYLLNIITILLCGMLLDAIVPVVIISVLFMVLQRYAGSYHAPNRIYCYVESIIMIVITLYVYKSITIPVYMQFIFMLMAVLSICFLAPVECKNKRLDIKEKKFYYQKTVQLCIVYAILICIFLFVQMDYISQMVLFALFDVLILQIIGKIMLSNEKKTIYNK